MKREKSIGVYLTLAGGIIAVIALIVYRTVMYQMREVNYLLLGAIGVSLLAFFLATLFPTVAGLMAAGGAFLMASAAVWGGSLMVNQIGYVFAGLDGVGTIMSFIIFAVVAVVGMLMYVIAAFLPAAKDVQ